MKQTSDGREVPSRIYYFLLEFNERDERTILNEVFKVDRLKDLDYDSFWELFKLASEKELTTFKQQIENGIQ
jgi:hypothetical protein